MLRNGAVLLAALALAGEGGSRMTEAADGRSAGLLLVANKGEHTLGIIDPALGHQPMANEERASSGDSRSSSSSATKRAGRSGSCFRERVNCRTSSDVNPSSALGRSSERSIRHSDDGASAVLSSARRNSSGVSSRP